MTNCTLFNCEYSTPYPWMHIPWEGRRLTPSAPDATPIAVSRPDGRPGYARKGAGEESPGSMDERCRITSGGVEPSRARLQGQCHREQTAAAA